MSDGHTMFIPPCDQHPPLGTWPTKNLILGVCPACGSGAGVDGRKTARVLRARQLLAGEYDYP